MLDIQLPSTIKFQMSSTVISLPYTNSSTNMQLTVLSKQTSNHQKIKTHSRCCRKIMAICKNNRTTLIYM